MVDVYQSVFENITKQLTTAELQYIAPALVRVQVILDVFTLPALNARRLFQYVGRQLSPDLPSLWLEETSAGTRLSCNLVVVSLYHCSMRFMVGAPVTLNATMDRCCCRA